ncbi:hypothetical protein BCR34DRAFT_580370 [Clohesyomyces aquaticus]|uniref:Rhodopsin domain-containing protein n=1 Tax=Clohesyomyces aquaticus TaxID=1231657 RepID=A0A1Y1Y6M3_9PLEO|nr:hypothetical protein BCR34DRAFT_580370 [Clohesyomyces aquaticus]
MASNPAAAPDLSSNLAASYLIPCGILAGIAFALCTARIYTRFTRLNRMGLDDYLILAAEILSFTNIFVVGASAAYGWGRPFLALTPAQFTQIMKLQFAVQTLWILTLALVRISVACSLLRFGTEKRWRMPLYAMITFQIAVSSGWLIVQFFQCRPLRSFWEIVPEMKCWGKQYIIDYAWFSAAFYVAMDLALALLPIKLILTLHRPPSEKLLICILMATGLLATGIAGAKMTTFSKLHTGDPMQSSIRPSMWAKLEEEVGIIAACMPCLKSPAERLLRKLGVVGRDGDVKGCAWVNSLSLRTVVGSVEEESRDPGDGTLRPGDSGIVKGKSEVRIDSVGLGTGVPAENRTSVQGDGASRKQGWEAV